MAACSRSSRGTLHEIFKRGFAYGHRLFAHVSDVRPASESPGKREQAPDRLDCSCELLSVPSYCSYRQSRADARTHRFVRVGGGDRADELPGEGEQAPDRLDRSCGLVWDPHYFCFPNR